MFVSTCNVIFVSRAPTLDVYDSHIDSQTIDLYLDGKTPKFNFRVDNKRNFQTTRLFPLQSFLSVSMRNTKIF